MSKKKYISADIEQLRIKCVSTIENNLFRLWMNRFDFSGLSRKQKRTIMKYLWQNGRIACGKIKHLEGPESLFFTDYVVQDVDYAYEPELIRFVNSKNAAFISNNVQIVNETCAIGWCNSSRNSLISSLRYYIDRMAECEIILRNSLLVTQIPFIVNLSPDTELKAKDLIDKIFNFEPVIFTEGGLNAVQALITGAPYIADKIRSIYYDYQSQCYTILGIDNTKMDGSNKQFVLTEQLDSNIAEINAYKNDIDTTIQDFLDDIKEFSGITIQLTDNLLESRSIYQSNEEAKQPSLAEDENEE